MDEEKAFTMTEIVKKLIGPVEATGDHGTDMDRLENLESHLLSSLC